MLLSFVPAPFILFAAIVVNTSWLPGVIEGIVATVIVALVVTLFVRGKRWITEWFTELLAHVMNVGHKVESNGLTSNNVGDIAKRTENTNAVLFRIMLATVDTSRLDPDLQVAIADLRHQYEPKP